MNTRRGFLKQSAGLATWALAATVRATALPEHPNPIGYATISWPDRELFPALDQISRLGFKGVQFLGWVSGAYSGKGFAELRDRIQSLRLHPVALSCSGIHPASGKDVAEKFRGYADFWKRMGGTILQVTDGGSPTRSYSTEEISSLGKRMNELGKMASDSGLELGYHPHFGTIGETREGLGRVLDATDARYVKLIADVAHLTLGGADPAEVIRAYHERLVLVHLKDVRRDVAALAGKDRNLVRRKECHFCEIGEGAVNYPAVVDAFASTGYRSWGIVELDPCESPPFDANAAAVKNRDAIRKLGFDV